MVNGPADTPSPPGNAYAKAGRAIAQKVDLEAVLQAAAKCGTMIEINANPYRLHLDWIHRKRAKALGVKLVINPARRGWLEKKNVFNTLSLAQVTKELEKRRK